MIFNLLTNRFWSALAASAIAIVIILTLLGGARELYWRYSDIDPMFIYHDVKPVSSILAPGEDLIIYRKYTVLRDGWVTITRDVHSRDGRHIVALPSIVRYMYARPDPYEQTFQVQLPELAPGEYEARYVSVYQDNPRRMASQPGSTIRFQIVTRATPVK